MKIRPARADESAQLTSLAMRAKAVWGYSKEFMTACRDELTVRPGDGVRYFCLEDDARVLGFYGLLPAGANAAELDGLFVEPGAIGRGIGTRLLAHARETARAAGAQRLIVQSDPNATGFYEAAGACPIGQRPSGSIPGRALPLLEFRLDAGIHQRETRC